MSADLSLVRRVEAAALKGWPALTSIPDGSWMVRLSEGHTGRANSINVLDPGDGEDADRRIAEAVEHYRSRNLPALLRATPLSPAGLPADLEAHGWQPYGHSLVMTSDIAGLAGGASVATPAAEPSDYWLRTMSAFMGFSGAKREAIGRKLARLEAEAGFFVGIDRFGTPVATALAVRDGDTLGIYEVGVESSQRRHGHGGEIVTRAMIWGASRGASLAYLQVGADNKPAVQLYRRLGFGESYRYRYLRPERS